MSAQLKEQVSLLPVSRIVPSSFNRRGDSDVTELAASIKQQGVLQPIVVRQVGDTYELVCGERRTRAARLAGLEFIPGLIRELSDAEAFAATITENLQREDMHPLEEAQMVLQLLSAMDRHGIASLLGKSPTWVSSRAQLSKLTEEWRTAVMAPTKADDGRWAIRFNQWPINYLEEVARLGEEAQGKLYRYWEQRNYIPTTGDLRDSIRKLTALLSSAPFPLDHEGLKPGPCTTCPMRTHARVDLFGEATGSNSEDACLNHPCFKSKLEQWGRLRLREVRAVADKGKLIMGLRQDAEHPEYFKHEGQIYQLSKKKSAATGVVLSGPDVGKTVQIEPLKESSKSKAHQSQGSKYTLEHGLLDRKRHVSNVHNDLWREAYRTGLGLVEGITIIDLLNRALNDYGDPDNQIELRSSLINAMLEFDPDNEELVDRVNAALNIDEEFLHTQAESKVPTPAEYQGKQLKDEVPRYWDLAKRQ